MSFQTTEQLTRQWEGLWKNTQVGELRELIGAEWDVRDLRVEGGWYLFFRYKAHSEGFVKSEFVSEWQKEAIPD